MTVRDRCPSAERAERPPLTRAAAWREIALTTAVLWTVLGAGCFVIGAQWIYDTWGTGLNAALILDAVYFIACLGLASFAWWRQRLAGETFAELGWRKRAPRPAMVIAVLFGLAWAALAYARGGDPLAITWQRPLMMAMGLILAFGEEIMVRGLILDRLARCGTSRLLQIVITGALMAVYHGIIGHHVWPSYWVSSFVLFSLLSTLFIASGRSMMPAYIAHSMAHVLGDPPLIQGILEGIHYSG